jgi:hypothetical protein
MSAPWSPAASAVIQPWSSSITAPQALNPFKCKSMGRDPMVQPPGYETLNLPQRPKRGPITRLEARIRLARVGGTSKERRLDGSICMVSPVQLTLTPRDSRASFMVLTSIKEGTPSRTTGLSLNSEPARSGKIAFFAPLIAMDPLSLVPPVTSNLSTQLTLPPPRSKPQVLT